MSYKDPPDGRLVNEKFSFSSGDLVRPGSFGPVDIYNDVPLVHPSPSNVPVKIVARIPLDAVAMVISTINTEWLLVTYKAYVGVALAGALKYA